jgi:murein DD-endopeptidase MepM/ murein hydrolase activator NlpD
VPENTPVLAAADGIVTSVNDDSTIGGANPIYWNFTNFIVIMHANEEYSRYDHLAPQSSKVKVGQAVSKGQEIAKVGMTGHTFSPHLHFQVFIFIRSNIWIDFDTEMFKILSHEIICLLWHTQRMDKNQHEQIKISLMFKDERFPRNISIN